MCAYGTAYQTFTRVVSTDSRLLSLRACCKCTLPHVQLQGLVGLRQESGQVKQFFLTNLAGAYPPRLARRIAELLSAGDDVLFASRRKEKEDQTDQGGGRRSLDPGAPASRWERELRESHSLHEGPWAPTRFVRLPRSWTKPWAKAVSFTWCKGSIDQREKAEREKRTRQLRSAKRVWRSSAAEKERPHKKRTQRRANLEAR